MKKDDKCSFAGTTAEQSTTADVSSVCQPIAKPNVGGSTVKELLKLRDQFFGDVLADAEMGAAMYLLEEVSKNPKCKDAPNGYTDEYSPQVFVCIQSIMRCKRRLRKSILKSDKELLANAKARLQKYFTTVDRDEQIRILKFVQPEPRWI